MTKKKKNEKNEYNKNCVNTDKVHHTNCDNFFHHLEKLLIPNEI